MRRAREGRSTREVCVMSENYKHVSMRRKRGRAFEGVFGHYILASPYVSMAGARGVVRTRPWHPW